MAELGRRIYFTTAVDLARRLPKPTVENCLHRELKNLVRPSLLVIDEVGYLTLDATQASLLFQVLCQRSAALDRLLHRATVLNIRGESYRLLDRRLASSRQPLTPGQPKRERREPRQAGEKEATTD